MSDLQRLDRRVWWLVGGALLLSLAITAWDHWGRWHTPRLEVRNFVMLWLYWAPRLAGLPLLVGLWLRWRIERGARRWRHPVYAALVLVGLWSSWIEPYWIRVRHTTLSGIPAEAQPLKLALVADIHWGLFFRDRQLDDLVDRLNAMDVDAVIVAGDWTHEPTQDLRAGFAPLARLRHPVWGVLGNHDTGAPGPPLAAALRQALQGHGVQLLEGQRLLFRGWEVLGLGDLWGGDPRGDVARLLLPGTPTVPRLVLAHQPDTAALLPAGSARLVLSGHTHGGQIMLPWITRHWVLPGMSAQGWFEGLNTTPAGPLFVTAGVGTIGLPARLAVVPRIDVLRIE